MGQLEARGTEIKHSEELKMFPTALGCAGFVSARGEPQAGSSVGPSSNLGGQVVLITTQGEMIKIK